MVYQFNYNSWYMKVIISLAQLHINLGNIQDNACRAYDMITEASKQSSSIILFPELWSSGYDLQNRQRYSQENFYLLSQLITYSKKFNMTIGGSLLLSDTEGNVYNEFTLIQPSKSSHLDRYRKIHLFRPMHEEQWLCAGDEMHIASFPWGKAGMATCYDLRFPEMFSYYAIEGACITFIPAEWPHQRVDHWKVLLRARAIENQMFIAAANTVGTIGVETFAGCSTIISPTGEILVEGSSHDEVLLTTEIDLELVSQTRNTIPILKDRRPDIYKNIKTTRTG